MTGPSPDHRKRLKPTQDNAGTKKVLYLSWTVPPDTCGSAIIAYNLARQFTRYEMVLAGERPQAAPALRWDDEWPEIEYVQSLWPFPSRGRRWWRRLQSPWLLLRCLRLVRRHRVGTIVVVYPCAQYLLTGYLVSKLTGRPLLAYFHNTCYENRQGVARPVVGWIQQRVFHHARRVFVISEGMAELFREHYPELNPTVLPHCFNEPIPEPPACGEVGNPLRLLFSGNLNPSCEDAAARLAKAIAGCPNTRLAIFSNTSRDYLRQVGLLADGVACQAVGRDELPRRLAEADVLLLPHGLTGPWSPYEYRTIFPTKTIEYLISGRPILAHVPPDAFLTRFLRRHDCAFIVDRPDVEALRSAIERLREDAALRSRLVQNALVAARQFQAGNVAAELRKWLQADGAISRSTD